MATIKLDLPEQLQEFVRGGWAANEEELVREAIRRFLDARRPELLAQFVREDVEWGLKGDE